MIDGIKSDRKTRECGLLKGFCEIEIAIFFVNSPCLSKHEQRLFLGSAFSSALHPWLAHYCQRFDASPALALVGHDGDSVSTLQKQKSAQCEGSPKFIKGIIRIWVPETFGASGFYFGFGIYRFSPGWKAEISLLRTTS